jgi:hypothetical protein
VIARLRCVARLIDERARYRMALEAIVGIKGYDSADVLSIARRALETS